MAYINGKQVLFSAQIHDGYNRGFADGQSSMIDESKIIEKTASGAYISVDDVSEIPHSVACKVESVNLWKNKDSYVIPGTGVSRVIESVYERFDETVVFSCVADLEEVEYSQTGNFVYLWVTYEDGTSVAKRIVGATTTSGLDAVSFVTLEASKDNPISSIQLNVHARFTSGTVTLSNIMVNNGTTALPFTPYVDDSTNVTVTRCGRNLLNPDKLEYGEFVEYNGVQCYKYRDNATNFKYRGVFLANTQYTFSFKAYAEDGNSNVAFSALLYYVDGSYDRILAFHNKEYTLVTAANKTVSYIKGVYSNNRVIYIDLEYTRLSLGATALPYEPYKSQTLTPKADGTVEGMTSVSPYMNIFTDNAGATLEATYRMSWGMQEERERFYNDFQQGKINVSISFEWLALDKANTTSVVNALSATTTGQTLTLKLSAVNTAFETSSGAADGSTSTEFAALVATKSNWTIVLK